MPTRDQQIAALGRRRERFDTKVEWLERELVRGFNMTMRARVRLAAQLVRDKTVINISTPVQKLQGRGSRSGQFTRARVRPGSRSSRGEFPRADTTRLLKDVYYEMGESGNEAVVGTTLDYGLILETIMDRSFLRRTLNEMQGTVTRILTTGRGGGGGVGLQFPET